MLDDMSNEEAGCLLIMAQGVPLLDLGVHSRWHEPLKSLKHKGYCDSLMGSGGNIEYVITEAGKAVAANWEDQSLMDVIEANNNAALGQTIPERIGRAVQAQQHAAQIQQEGFSDKQVRALANFYWKMTGRNPSEICEP